MSTRPNTAQSDRDHLDDIGLADLCDRPGCAPHAVHTEEPMPS